MEDLNLPLLFEENAEAGEIAADNADALADTLPRSLQTGEDGQQQSSIIFFMGT